MAPTVQQIKDALSFGIQYVNKSYWHYYQPSQTSLEAPQKVSGMAAYCHDVNAPPLVCIRPRHEWDELDHGSLTYDSEADAYYYPLLMKTGAGQVGSFEFIRLNNANRVSLEIDVDEVGQTTGLQNNYKYYKCYASYSFHNKSKETGAFSWMPAFVTWPWTKKEPEDKLVTVQFRYESRWDYDNDDAPNYEIEMRKTYEKDGFDGVVVWLPDKCILDDRVIWKGTAAQGEVHSYKAVPVFPIRMQKAYSAIVGELAGYVDNSELESAAAAFVTWADTFECLPDIWDVDRGVLNGDDATWYHSTDAFKDHELFDFAKNCCSHTLSLSPYRSRSSYKETAWMYMNSIFPLTVTCLCKQAQDDLLRKTGSARVKSAYYRLKECEWDGYGTRMFTYVNMGMGDISYYMDLSTGQWNYNGIRLKEGAYREYHGGGASPVYPGYWTAPFLYAAVLLWKAACEEGETAIRDEVREWCDEAAEVMLKIQVPYNGLVYVHGIGDVCLPQMAGSFLNGYQMVEPAPGGSGQPIKFKYYRGVVEHLAESYLMPMVLDYSELTPSPFPYTGMTEATIWGLLGLKRYKELILEDYT